VKDEREGLGKVVGMIYGVISFGGGGYLGFRCLFLLLFVVDFVVA
jgi:hypothetical protein